MLQFINNLMPFYPIQTSVFVNDDILVTITHSFSNEITSAEVGLITSFVSILPWLAVSRHRGFSRRIGNPMGFRELSLTLGVAVNRRFRVGKRSDLQKSHLNCTPSTA